MTRASGFTLLEVMVAIVLTGLVVLLAYGAAQVSYDAHARLSAELRALQQARALRELLQDALVLLPAETAQGRLLLENAVHPARQRRFQEDIDQLFTRRADLLQLRPEATQAQVLDRSVIASIDAPLAPEGGIAVLRGSLAPDGAVIKQSAASPSLLRHRGPAVVFEDVYDVQARIDDPALEVGSDSVLVLRNSGPKGGPGMPEWGQVPIPKKLLERGITDLVRVSDARMSGTAFGTVVLHVAPESAAGGPLRAVEDGDPIVLDVEERRIDLDVPSEEVRRRLDRLGPPEGPAGVVETSIRIGWQDQGRVEILEGLAEGDEVVSGP